VPNLAEKAGKKEEGWQAESLRPLRIYFASFAVKGLAAFRT
jgi:hypothetical protein